MIEKFDAFNFARDFHWTCRALKLPNYHKDQLIRASSSIALNVAEGAGKRTPKEQRHFYSNALGSLRECQAILALEKIKNPEIQELTNRLGAILFTLVHRENQKTVPQTPNLNPKSPTEK